MIEVKNLTFDYPGTRALNSVSFSIESKTITALVGPNGSGKTTLLKCIATLLTPDKGEIIIGGNDIKTNPNLIKRDIGFLQDFFGLYDDLTIEQALTYYGLAYSLSIENINARIEFLCNKLGLSNRKAKLSKLSRGMRQRVAIAQSIIHNPQVLLLDEPASGLDPESRYALGELFKELNDMGMTLIVSSHILAELDQYATHLLIIRNGRILEHSPILAAKDSKEFLLVSFSITEYIPDSEAKIRSFAAVNDVLTSNNKFTVRLSAGATIKQEFLKHLIDSGLPVEDFYVEKLNLQEQYLQTINRGSNVH